MIHAENYSVRLEGTKKEIIADLGCVMLSVYRLLSTSENKLKVRRVMREALHLAMTADDDAIIAKIDNSGGEA